MIKKILLSTARILMLLVIMSSVPVGVLVINNKSVIEGNSTAPSLQNLHLDKTYANREILTPHGARKIPAFPGNAKHMSADQKMLFRLMITKAPTSVPPLLDAIKDQLNIGIYVKTHCGMASCATMHKKLFLNNTYNIEYYGPHFSPNTQGRYIMMHEIGHVLQYAYISQTEMDAFFKEFRKSPSWQDCYTQPEQIKKLGQQRNGKNCVRDGEIFADQFAYFSMGTSQWYSNTDPNQNLTLSGYKVPMLMSYDTFSLLFETFTKSRN